jgi:nicotinamide-nucleotide amidase
VANEDVGLETIVGRLLKEHGKTMGTAESCTGGYIAQLLTSVPGASAYYRGSVVSYANDIKQGLLDVSEKTLQEHGAVSRETVIEMAKGALRRLGADYIIATSGIMGPDGGSAEKPVGTVWIAVANADRVDTQQLQLRFERERNISQTAITALNLLRKFILET